MYKLPISKYKNATPKLVKKEQSINALSTNRLLNTIGNLINCNLNYVAFAFDTQSGGGSMCVTTHNDLNKKSTFNSDIFATVHAHSAALSDIQFNPFVNNILATGAFEAQINLWKLSDGDHQKVSINQSSSLNLVTESRCDSIQWNPNVENILISSSLSNLYLWDVEHNSVVNSITKAHCDHIQSTSWKRDGSLLVTSSKDKSMQIIDPRSNDGFTKIENAKTNNKDSKVVWFGNSDSILSSVYTMNHQRELHLWDVRNTSAPSFEFSIDIGNNVLTPYLDSDTGMLFLAGKAESVVRYYEVFPDIPNIAFNTLQTLDDQIKSISVLPKFGLDLMKCEINRLILLTRSSVYPMPYIIPRRSYYEFHADVFPDTFITQPNVVKQDWLNGTNGGAVPKARLNPETQKQFNSGATIATTTVETKNGHSNSGSGTGDSFEKKSEPNIVYEQQASDVIISVPFTSVRNKVNEANNKLSNDHQESPTIAATTPQTPTASTPVSFNILREKKPQTLNTPIVTQNRADKTKSIYYQSKFKYINGKVAHKNDQITNIRNMSTMWPGECNGFQVNPKRAAFLLAGAGGQISVVELSKPGRLTDSVIYSIINKSKVSDFAWDPFDDERLAAACDECVVKIWQIPSEGLVSSMEEPSLVLKGHLERLYCIKYHPYVRNLLASASYDRTIRLWNVETGVAVRQLTGHTDVIFSMSWNPNGSKLATICKDGFLRVYEPIESETPMIQEKAGPPSGGKSARIEWVMNGNALLISGFGKGNLRQIYLYGSEDINQLQVEDINQSPSLLIPIYDSDVNVLFLYAKGEETIYLYEIQSTEPYFQVLTPYKPEGGIHFALAFLPKQLCDIKGVEIAKAYRLTKDNRIESISFTVPRVKQTLFQDDIFPDTIDRRQPYLEANEWFDAKPIDFKYISLQPNDMQRLTDVLAVEQEHSSAIKKENKKPDAAKQPHGMIDQDQIGEKESQIIGKMLQRAALYKEDSSGGEEEETDDWQ